MTRLTNHIKQQIVDNALEQAGVNRDRDSITERRAKLAEDVRTDSLGGSDRVLEIEKIEKKIHKLDALLKGICRYSFSLTKGTSMRYCNIGGAQVHLYFNGGRIGEGDSVKKIRPSEVVYKAGHRFVNEFHSIENDSKKLNERIEELSLQVRASVNQFTTVKKLLTAWPEAKELLPKKIEESKPQLPAILVKDLNKLIGLPK